MFGLNESTQFYVCKRYVRMNLGINGLYQIVRTEMELPPLGGAVFIFFSKNRQQVKTRPLRNQEEERGEEEKREQESQKQIK